MTILTDYAIIALIHILAVLYINYMGQVWLVLTVIISLSLSIVYLMGNLEHLILVCISLFSMYYSFSHIKQLLVAFLAMCALTLGLYVRSIYIVLISASVILSLMLNLYGED